MMRRSGKRGAGKGRGGKEEVRGREWAGEGREGWRRLRGRDEEAWSIVTLMFAGELLRCKGG